MQASITTKRAKSRAKPMHHSVPAWSPPARNLNISSAHFERASRGSHVSPARSMQCLPSGLGLRTLRPLRPLRPCMLARPAVPSLFSLCSLFSTPACSQSYTIPTPLSRWQSPSPQPFQPFRTPACSQSYTIPISHARWSAGGSPRLPQHVSRNTSPRQAPRQRATAPGNAAREPWNLPRNTSLLQRHSGRRRRT